MNKIHTGGCMCGAIQYEYHGSFGPIVYCHCSVCRKAQGTAFGTNAPINEVDFTLVRGTEALKAYESSPGKQRLFCSQCGSPMFSRNQKLLGVLRLRIGTLDTPLDVRPQHIFTQARRRIGLRFSTGFRSTKPFRRPRQSRFLFNDD